MSVSKFAFRVGPRGGNFLLGDAPAVTAQVLHMQLASLVFLSAKSENVVRRLAGVRRLPAVPACGPARFVDEWPV